MDVICATNPVPPGYEDTSPVECQQTEQVRDIHHDDPHDEGSAWVWAAAVPAGLSSPAVLIGTGVAAVVIMGGTAAGVLPKPPALPEVHLKPELRDALTKAEVFLRETAAAGLNLLKDGSIAPQSPVIDTEDGRRAPGGGSNRPGGVETLVAGGLALSVTKAVISDENMKRMRDAIARGHTVDPADYDEPEPTPDASGAGATQGPPRDSDDAQPQVTPRPGIWAGIVRAFGMGGYDTHASRGRPGGGDDPLVVDAQQAMHLLNTTAEGRSYLASEGRGKATLASTSSEADRISRVLSTALGRPVRIAGPSEPGGRIPDDAVERMGGPAVPRGRTTAEQEVAARHAAETDAASKRPVAAQHVPPSSGLATPPPLPTRGTPTQVEGQPARHRIDTPPGWHQGRPPIIRLPDGGVME